MKNFGGVEPGTTVTVSRITGGKKIRKDLEKKGIMAGTDLTMLCTEKLRVRSGKGECDLSTEEAEAIRFSEQFKRNNDPILPGGCCAYGNTAGMLERMSEVNDQLFRESDE